MSKLSETVSHSIAEQRFIKQLQTLQPMMMASVKSENYALTLYRSGARQTLFYLEGLARMYRNMHNRKRFERMRIAFKLIEDQLGKVDYYDSFVKEFSAQENFPPVLLSNLKQHYDEELIRMIEILREHRWITDDFFMFKKLLGELRDADWKKAKKDRRAIAEIMLAQVNFVQDSYERGVLNFQSIEKGVHEFRRQIRWISIYAQALDGLIQLRQVEVPNPKLQMYLTKEIIDNPFNKMPEPEKNIQPVFIEAPNFYALSWIIEKGGQLKDEALRIIVIEDAMTETKFTGVTEIKQTARELTTATTHSLHEIKDSMEVIADDFIYDHKVLKRIGRDLLRELHS